jgi:glycosyltransferase involved in cell wall biosynthesis
MLSEGKLVLTTETSSHRAAKATMAFRDQEAAQPGCSPQPVPEAPLITLVLPYYNEAGWIGTTLQSLARQSDRRFRLVLIDNASTDTGCAEATAACAQMTDIDVRHVHAEQPGKISALLAGTAGIDTPFVATIDADTIYPKDYVARILRLFAANPKASAVMAIDLVAPMDSRQSRKRVRRIMRKARLFPCKCHAGGYAQAYRSDALARAGGFTPAIWPYTLEDHEITARVFRFGLPVYAADHVCFPSDRRSDRRSVDWTWGERLLYKLSPACLTVAFFHVFLAWRLRTRRAFSAELRQKSWM